jgi:hypothetical protein
MMKEMAKHQQKGIVRYLVPRSGPIMLSLTTLLALSFVLAGCSSPSSTPGSSTLQAALPTPTLEPTFTPSPPPTNTQQPSPTATPAEPTPTPTPQSLLSGRILDQDTNQPVAGAIVRVGTASATTDAEGHYALSGLPPGQYVLSITRPDYDPGLSSIFTLSAGQEQSLDLTLYTSDTSPYPKDPMLTNPLDPDSAPTPEDAERLARLQGLTGKVVGIREAKLSGEYLVNYKIGDEVRAAVAELNHDVWELTDDAGRKWWIIKVCGNLASPLPAKVAVATPQPRSLPPMAEVVTDGLITRECTSETCAEVGTVQRGARLEVLGCLADGSWCQVGLSGGGSGWCTGRSLRQLAVAAAVPVLPAILPTTTTEVAAREGKIAFLSTRDHWNVQMPPCELYIMNSDDSQQTRITTAKLPNTSSELTWLPGDGQLFYEAGGPTWGIINLQDGAHVPWQPPIPVRVNNEIRVVGVNWSPDGQNIAYINSHFERLSVVGADGNSRRLLFEAGEGEQLGFPFWAPDGRKIAFSSRNQVHTISPDGSDLVTVADTWGRMISWSPDGTRIAFECGKPGVSTYWSQDICVVNVDGTGLRDLTNTKDIWEWHPTWSPDGEQIAFHVMAYTSGGATPSQIYVIDADGTDLTQLTSEGSNCCPAWSR